MNSRFLFGVLLLLVVFSCDYQKRLYRKGFYVHWNSKVRTHDYEHKLIEPKISASALTKNQEEVILAHNDKMFFYAKKQKDEPCADTLVLKSGEELVVKILEINETSIKYKRLQIPVGSATNYF